MTHRKKAKDVVQPWTEAELKWLKDQCARDPNLKATEIAEMFLREFKTRSFPAVEHRVYKLRREGEVRPRRSVILTPTMKVLAGQGLVTDPQSYVLRFPNGSTFIGTREQVLNLLGGAP